MDLLPQFYFVVLMTILTLAISYTLFFEYSNFVNTVTVEIDWIIANFPLGILLFFSIAVLSHILCMPQIYQGIFLGFILSKKFGLIVCIFGGSMTLLFANLIGGMIAFFFARLCKKSLRYI